MSGPRVVTLIASATEIVCALGCESLLVGRSHECDYPPSILDRPPCSSPRIDIVGNSREIDDRVKEALKEQWAIYDVHAEKLRALRPDVIVTQTQCEVCAVSLRDVERAMAQDLGFTTKIVPLAPNRLEDMWDDIQRVADALGIPDRGRSLNARLQEELQQLRIQTESFGVRPTIACVEWIDPLMMGGNWMPQLVEIAGGRSILSQVGTHSPYVTWEQLQAEDPDVIAILPCGWDIAKGREEMAFLTQRAEWSNLRAVRNSRVYVTDGNQYFNRPGPRLVESARIFAEILHPGEIAPLHHGTGWVRFEDPSPARV
ncbi:MAG: cobalamin-binding protein [Planctomycetales bacterium]